MTHRKKSPINANLNAQNKTIEDPQRTPSNLEFSLAQIIEEEPSTKKLYALQFCDNLPDYYNYFATAGDNTVNIYRILENNSSVEIIHSYVDEDEDECFYCCAFSATEIGTPILVVAGSRGTLKGIDLICMEIVAILPGHGKAVNDLKVHPVNDELIVSASYDKSIRLWNIRTCVCIAIFGGVKGHMSQAICVDIHPLGNLLMSGGMDSSLKIWNLQDPKIEEAISLSYTNPRKAGNVAFDTYTAQFPLYSTKEVHRGYIDCARWVGGFILSKSTENKLCLWTPDSNRFNQSASILREFPLPNSDQWFIKFDINIPLNIHAVGNTAGKVYIYTTLDDITNEKDSEYENSSIDNDNCVAVDDTNEDGAGVTGGAAYHKAVLSHPKCDSTVRAVAFSPNNNYLVVACDSAMIFVWSIKNTKI